MKHEYQLNHWSMDVVQVRSLLGTACFKRKWLVASVIIPSPCFIFFRNLEENQLKIISHDINDVFHLLRTNLKLKPTKSWLVQCARDGI